MTLSGIWPFSTKSFRTVSMPCMQTQVFQLYFATSSRPRSDQLGINSWASCCNFGNCTENLIIIKYKYRI